jgi:pimeloyl-ACP methyl ester carboxylesterase
MNLTDYFTERLVMDTTIVMIHGMWGGGWCWDQYRPFFENEGYHCITPILRYHDLDPNDEPDSRLGTVSLLDYADDLEKQIRKLDAPIILMGHSMGGLLSQILASRNLAEAAVLLAPAAPYGTMGLTYSVIRSFLSTLTTWKFWRKPVRQTFNEASYSTLGVLPTDRKKEEFAKLGYESGRAVLETGLWPLDSAQASKVDESKVTCPVLIIAGVEDKITPASVIRKIANKYKEVAVYKELEHHGHALLGEPGWEEIAEYTSVWLKKVLSTREFAVESHVEQRKFSRTQYNAPIAFARSDSESYYHGNMDSYSPGGLHFTSNVEIKPGSEINIKWVDSVPEIKGSRGGDLCRAKVIWYKQREDRSLYDIGAQFSEMPVQ